MFKAERKELLHNAKIQEHLIENTYNSGVSYSRNRGIEKALGNYVGFVDHDDKISKRSIIELVERLQAKEIADLIVTPYTTLLTENGNHKYDSLYIKERVENGLEILNNSERLQENNNARREYYHVCLSAWGKLYSKVLLEKANIRFQEDIDKFEDCIFGIQFLNEAGAVVYENVKYYTYNQERTTNSGLSNKYRLEDWLNYIQKVEDSLSPKLIKTNAAKEFISIFLVGTLIRYISSIDFRSLNSGIRFLKKNITEENINYLKVHNRPCGADKILTYLIKREKYLESWLYLKGKQKVKSSTYNPPFWCTSEYSK